MARPYATLRALIKANDETNAYLAERVLNISPTALSFRLNGKSQWPLDDMYIVMDHYKVPHEYLHMVFPRDGKNGETGKPNNVVFRALANSAK